VLRAQSFGGRDLVMAVEGRAFCGIHVQAGSPMNEDFRYSLVPKTQNDLEQLAISAVGAADKAGMLEEVTRRLFDRSPGELIEEVDKDASGRRRRYRPMVELLLLELSSIGSDTSADTAEQQRRIMWTLDLAGF
jgi:hypothetical protein